MSVKGIHHISMNCGEKYEETVRFYQEVIGFPIRRRWNSGIMLDTGNGYLELFAREGNAVKGVIRHFAIAADDTDEVIERVRKAGYEVFEEPHDIVIPCEEDYPARIAFFHGPLGEDVEIFCEK